MDSTIWKETKHARVSPCMLVMDNFIHTCMLVINTFYTHSTCTCTVRNDDLYDLYMYFAGLLQINMTGFNRCSNNS